jgi:hypothetical protein
MKSPNPSTLDTTGCATHLAILNHQFFTGDIGVPELKEHLSNLVFLMKASDNWNDFIDRLDRARPKGGDTFRLPF